VQSVDVLLSNDIFLHFPGLIEAFSGRMNIHIEDVHLIVNYDKMFQHATDPHLGKLHKKQQTQHCWCFQAVASSVYFPLGVKVRCCIAT